MNSLITLANKNTQKLIQDVVIYPLKINSDETGILVETLRTDWPDVYSADRPFAMQYFSITQPGVARDESVWHYHPTVQDDRFLVADGTIIVAIADNREGSATFGLLNLFLIDSASAPYLVLVPRRTLHGFMVVSRKPAILLNFPTGLYNPSEEGRIPYSDAQVKTADGRIFSWKIAKEFYDSIS